MIKPDVWYFHSQPDRDTVTTPANKSASQPTSRSATEDDIVPLGGYFGKYRER